MAESIRTDLLGVAALIVGTGMLVWVIIWAKFIGYFIEDVSILAIIEWWVGSLCGLASVGWRPTGARALWHTPTNSTMAQTTSATTEDWVRPLKVRSGPVRSGQVRSGQVNDTEYMMDLRDALPQGWPQPFLTTPSSLGPPRELPFPSRLQASKRRHTAEAF